MWTNIGAVFFIIVLFYPAILLDTEFNEVHSIISLGEKVGRM